MNYYIIIKYQSIQHLACLCFFLILFNMEDVWKEAVEKYLTVADESIIFTPTLGGINNVVKKVRVQENEFILRIYNNGHNLEKVLFEHLVLVELNKLALSFEIPNALKSLDDARTHVLLSDGSEASMFTLIPGVLPKLTCGIEIGKACGELTRALAAIEVDYPPQTPPYFEIYKVHHAINREIFFREIESAKFDDVRAGADAVEMEIRQIEDLISQLLALNLPQQLIHGDLHYDNVLAIFDSNDRNKDKVTGIVDFEFVANDWRAMDLAICLSKYASEANPMLYFRQVIHGYRQYITLTSHEIEALSDLIILRILSNVVFFVGRAMAGEDSYQTLIVKIEPYLQRISWLRNHKADISSCFFVL